MGKILEPGTIDVIILFLLVTLAPSIAISKDYQFQYTIEISEEALIGYSSLQLIGYSVDNEAFVAFDQQPRIYPGRSFLTPVIYTNLDIEDQDHTMFMNIELRFRLTPHNMYINYATTTLEVEHNVFRIRGSAHPSSSVVGVDVLPASNQPAPSVNTQFNRNAVDIIEGQPSNFPIDIEAIVAPPVVGTILYYVMSATR